MMTALYSVQLNVLLPRVKKYTGWIFLFYTVILTLAFIGIFAGLVFDRNLENGFIQFLFTFGVMAAMFFTPAFIYLVYIYRKYSNHPYSVYTQVEKQGVPIDHLEKQLSNSRSFSKTFGAGENYLFLTAPLSIPLFIPLNDIDCVYYRVPAGLRGHNFPYLYVMDKLGNTYKFKSTIKDKSGLSETVLDTIKSYRANIQVTGTK